MTPHSFAPPQAPGGDGTRILERTALLPDALAPVASPRPAPPVRTRVVILLATYDGAAFLPDQLASLAKQEHDDWELLWRDDGSTDATVPLLEAFAATQPAGRVRRLPAPDGHVGSAAGFLCLLRAALPTLAPSDMVAFADQDDVWLPFKLARAVRLVRSQHPERPTLYSARQILVDAKLNTLALSAIIIPAPGFPASLTQNLATGCTVVLNHAAARLVANSTAPATCQHDWWAYLLVTAAGGIFLADKEPVVLYRQHGRNAVGAPRGFLRRGLAALHRGPGVFMDLMRHNVAALDTQRHLLTPQARAQLDTVKSALAAGPADRLRALRLPGLRRQTWAEQTLFRLWFVIG